MSEMVLIKANTSQVGSACDDIHLQQQQQQSPDPYPEHVFKRPSPPNTAVHDLDLDLDYEAERQKRLLPSNTVNINDNQQQQEQQPSSALSSLAGAESTMDSEPAHHVRHYQLDKLPSHIPRNIAIEILDEHQQRSEEICRILIRDMNNWGVCVLDEFLGEVRGRRVLEEVVTMYSEGKFKDGQLVGPAPPGAELRDLKHIRGDKITWIGGREQGCVNIGYLINQVRPRFRVTGAR